MDKFKKYKDYSYATLKVCKDKLYEYMLYYIWMEHDDSDKAKTDDKLDDYGEVIDIAKYVPEDDGYKRIFRDVGFFKKYSIFFSEPTHVIDNIYLGSAFNAASYRILKKLDIKIIINVTHEISKYHTGANSTKFTYHQYGIYDNNKTSIEDKLDEIYNTITEYDKNTNILVHCFMGASRSVSVVIYYLMKSKNFSLDVAIEYLRNKRPIINPSYRFAKDLASSMIETNESGNSMDQT